MNELTPIPQLKTEIQFYEKQTATGMLEIGKRLIQIKEQLPHGEFEGWVKRELNYSRSTASRFIKCSEEFGNVAMSQLLNPSQMVEMLGLPEEVKTEIVEKNDMSEMTIRQLREEVKKFKEAAQILTQRNDDLMRERQTKTEPEIIEVVKEVVKVPDDYDRAKKEVDGWKSRYQRLHQDREKLLDENKVLRDQTKDKKYYQGLDVGVMIAYMREFIANMKKYEAMKDDLAALQGSDEEQVSTWIRRVNDQMTTMEMLIKNMEVTIIE